MRIERYSARIVRMHRSLSGLSQEAYSAAICVHEQTVSKLERGVLPLSEEIFMKMMAFLPDRKAKNQWVNYTRKKIEI